MSNQPTLTEQYDEVESLYKQFLTDVRASGLESVDRWVWYTRAWLALDNNATADAQIAALKEVRAQWEKRHHEAAKLHRISTRLAIGRILGGSSEWTTSARLYKRLRQDGNPLSDEETSIILGELIAENVIQEVRSGLGFSFFRFTPHMELES